MEPHNKKNSKIKFISIKGFLSKFNVWNIIMTLHRKVDFFLKKHRNKYNKCFVKIFLLYVLIYVYIYNITKILKN